MQSQRVLSADELTQIIGAHFAYNNLDAVDIAFDVRGGTIAAIVTVDDAPMELADQPHRTVMDKMSADMLHRMQTKYDARVG